jgi:hypothetical protein
MFGLPLMIFLFLTISLVFFFQKKPFSFLQNSILYMVFKIMITNVTTILTLNLSLIKTTENPFLFPAYLLYRDGIIPLILLIFINMVHAESVLKSKVIYSILIFAFLNGFVILLLYLNLTEFRHWNLFKAAAVNAAYLLFALGAGKLILLVSRRSTLHDSRI